MLLTDGANQFLFVKFFMVIIFHLFFHEDYQEIKGKKYPMDERVLIADILAGK